MATHSSILAWRIPQTEEPGGLQPMVSQRVWVLRGILPKVMASRQQSWDLRFEVHCPNHWTSLVAQMVKNLPAVPKTWVQPLSQENPLEKKMATHSNILAWRIPQTEEPGRLQSMGSQRIEHNWATNTHSNQTHLPAGIQMAETLSYFPLSNFPSA